MFWFFLARWYARLLHQLGKRFDFHPPGLGWLCRRIRREFVLEVEGCRYVFYPPAASMYSFLIGGLFPEKETHAFFQRMLPSAPPCTFIDVGAAVGEMIADVLRYPAVKAILAFEPNSDYAEACRRHAKLAGYSRLTMVERVVSDREEGVHFVFNRGHGTSGRIASHPDRQTEQVISTTVDAVCADVGGEVLMLIDVEGAELKVLSGARNLIQRAHPLIIFEYNEVSRRHFQLEQIGSVLGEGYTIYRLRSDGMLDDDLQETWNCVVIFEASVWSGILQGVLQPPCAS